MFARRKAVWLVFAAVAGVASPGLGQTPATPAARVSGERSDSAGSNEPRLIYEREMFVFPVVPGRRDPFTPLTGANELGPRFEDLSLRGIIYSPAPGQSVALVATKNGKVYRIRRGDVVGNARVLEIGQSRVVFAVNNLGVVRQAVLELKRKGKGANG
ncbi:MAG TPA: hypothetical protein VIL13_12885 [Longimicrobiales bacterium]|jgi:hypothetical protein